MFFALCQASGGIHESASGISTTNVFLNKATLLASRLRFVYVTTGVGCSRKLCIASVGKAGGLDISLVS